MGELAIRRNRTLAVARQQTTVRTEKSGGTASGQKSASAGDVISETLRQKFGGVRLAEVRESRRTCKPERPSCRRCRSVLGAYLI